MPLNKNAKTARGASSGAVFTFARKRAELIELSLEKPPVDEEFPGKNSRLVDAYFDHRLKELDGQGNLPKKPFALIAVGGYGRQELCLGSDIDILLLFEGRIPKKAATLSKGLFFPLWDLSLDVGHTVRSKKENLKLASTDHQVLTSLLDARLITGNLDIFRNFESDVRNVLKRNSSRFLEQLRKYNGEREKKYGDSSYFLEPDIKNGIGGLRDYHQFRWIQRLLSVRGASCPDFFSHSDALYSKVSYLHKVRSALHMAAGRKQDKLFFDLQLRTAEILGYENTQKGRAVEEFLADLHGAMSWMKSWQNACWQWLDSVPVASCPEIESTREPSVDLKAVLQCFLHASENNLQLGWQTQQTIQKSLHKQKTSPPFEKKFLETFFQVILRDREKLLGGQLMENGVVKELLPGFAQVQNRVQFDAYHIYPVGRHTMEALYFIADMHRGKEGLYAGIFEEIENPEVLFLGALFHDLGKDGECHEEKGSRMAAEILQQYSYSQEDIETVSFLVLNHLLLFSTSTRMNLNDEAVVSGCARRIGSEDRLNMLFLLSAADAMATGPKAWNEWTEALLKELFFKIKKLLTKGILSNPTAIHQVLTTRDKVRQGARDTYNMEEIEYYLGHMPTRYTLFTSAEEIVRHMDLIRELEKNFEVEKRRVPGGRGGAGLTKLDVRPLPQQGCYEMVFAAKDQDRFFATVCGVLALLDVNIYEAEIYTWTNGTVVDIFRIQNPPENLELAEFSSKVVTAVRSTLNGKLSLEYRLEEKRKSPLAKKRNITGFAPRITFDNLTSDFYTMIEVVADDRLGMLYEIADCLHKMKVQVQLAKIATQGDRIVDVFFVRDHLGQKIEDAGQVREIQKVLKLLLTS